MRPVDGGRHELLALRALDTDALLRAGRERRNAWREKLTAGEEKGHAEGGDEPLQAGAREPGHVRVPARVR